MSMFDVWANQNENIDYRRAASLVILRLQLDYDHFRGHIAEATGDGRLVELITTTAQCFLTAMPELHSPKGVGTLSQITSRLSGEEDSAS